MEWLPYKQYDLTVFKTRKSWVLLPCHHSSTDVLKPINYLICYWKIIDCCYLTSQVVMRFQFSSIQFSCSVVSDSLWPHEPQHARPPCPSPTPVVYPNPRPLSRWCHPTISSSVIPFSSWPQSLPASGSFPVTQLFPLGGQVLEFQLQHQSFQWIFRTDFL